MRPDLLGVVECAYLLHGSEAEWLGRVAARILPFFDQGLGMMAGTFVAHGPRAFQMVPVLATVPPAIVEVTRKLHTSAAAPQLARAYTRRIGLNWARETIDPEGDDAASLATRTFFEAVGADDFYAVIFTDPTGRGAIFSVARKRRDRPSAAVLHAWSCVAAHLAAGLRLARNLGKVEAVLHPGGRIAHAEGPAVALDAREALRRASVAIDRSRGSLRRRDGDEALRIWRGLVDGRWSLVDRFDQDGRRYLVAHRNDPRVRDPRALTLRERQVVGYVALGQANKVVAYTLGITESAVASHLSAAMTKLGVRSRVDLVAWLGRVATLGHEIAPWRK